MIKFDGYQIRVNGNVEGEFDPSSQGCYLTVFRLDAEGMVQRSCIGRFGKYAGKAGGLAEAKRWVKAVMALYPTGTELYAALVNAGEQDGRPAAPGQLLPIPPPRGSDRRLNWLKSKGLR